MTKTQQLKTAEEIMTEATLLEYAEIIIKHSEKWAETKKMKEPYATWLSNYNAHLKQEKRNRDE